MSESSTRLANVAGTVVKRDPRTQKAATARRQQRTETLSNVTRNVSRLVIWAIAMVMILSELGVNVAPVIASLGVVGLAAGIGAQTIIKDIVAGVVMLFEDVISVGDSVDLEYATGTVEGINLRVTQVRALDGTLWTVRNGEIIRIGNMSRGFSNAVITLDIDAAADNARVSSILQEVTAAFTKDSSWEHLITGEPAISGILGVDGSRFQRRIMIRVTPGDKSDVEQELRRRIRIAFAEAHIPFALPRYQETP
ncbi:mechanosensitive ion channel family protein [Brachybacterium sp. DNPG3]